MNYGKLTPNYVFILLESYLTSESDNLRKLILEHNKCKEKLNEINTKKDIAQVIKSKLRVKSISPCKTRNFIVRMSTIKSKKK